MVSGGDLICLELAHMVVALGLNFVFWAGTNTVAFFRKQFNYPFHKSEQNKKIKVNSTCTYHVCWQTGSWPHMDVFETA